ncbi:Ribonuclease H [Hyphodiscus hymeniophilus]|uniref:ribonuclease H n=1 Tax=Hyphodiscus hymeniophilus TaxID=353542 RepID=A0A9P7AUB5_9HELO|nr:Ribonuclease H [Hyphodiscus hymeniophilus]
MSRNPREIKFYVVPGGILEPGIPGVYNPILLDPLPLGPPTFAFPAIFIPPCASDTPEELFTPGYRTLPNSVPHLRFVRRSDPDQILLWTDGSCLQNGQEGARAGFAVKHRPSPNPAESTFASPAIAALLYRLWQGEGWKSLVIATDSEYVAIGATEWVKKWESNGWRTSGKDTVKNQDLWQLLLRAVRRLDQYGIRVLFWRIPRALNQDADRAARKAAEEDMVEEFTILSGVMCGYTRMVIAQMSWSEAIREEHYEYLS